MSILRKPPLSKVLIIYFSKEKTLLEDFPRELEGTMGSIDYTSPLFPFTETAYYEEEMGGPLFLRISSIGELTERTRLPDIKHRCLELEDKFSQVIKGNKKRRINIDPGMLQAENIILATGKGYSHRIYLGDGVWAEVTLIYHGTSYTALPTTYPSYKNRAVCDILNTIRKDYLKLLK